jgi:uncharacterized protein (TIGR00661 family)
MRILYGVFGYGRGHATRALSVLPELRRRHEIVLVAGGDAYDQLSPEHEVVRIPTLHYEYADGKRSLSRTLGENMKHLADIVFSGPGYGEVARLVRELRPDAAICDAEPWLHTASARLGVPRISFDHFGVMAYCRPPIPVRDRLRSVRDVWAYRALMGRPDRVIVSSFYDGGARNERIRFVGPLLRPEVLARQPSRGDHLLVYLNQGVRQLTPRVEAALRAADARVVIYGVAGRTGDDGNLSFQPPSNGPFLDHLASCRAVVSTAGNQLVGEAIYFRKPMLVFPENTVEQRLNAAHVRSLGIGALTTADTFAAADITSLLAREETYRSAMARVARDGRAESLAAIEHFVREITSVSHRAGTCDWRYA